VCQSLTNLGIKKMIAVKNHIPCSCSLLVLLDSHMGYTEVTQNNVVVA
jgi:hypothetical protein